MKIRRVVTSDQDGLPVVTIDEVMTDTVSPRPGVTAAPVWGTNRFPADNTLDEDGSSVARAGAFNPNGTVLRMIEFAPGNQGWMHRTDSLDYVIVVSGEVEMDMEGGETVVLKAGDVLIQKGTVHSWVNRTDQTALIAVILIGANPTNAAK